jgi:hypothetical protein
MASESKQSFFEDFVFFVPEGECCADVLMSIAESSDTIFALILDWMGWDCTQR